MPRLYRIWFAAVAFFAAAALHADPLLPPEPVPLDSLAAFRPAPPNWQIAGGLAGDPRREKALHPTSGTGLLVSLPRPGNDDLLTVWEHADLDLELEYLLPARSNSGVYLMGRYEVQLYDSWGVKTPKVVDNGSIYERWDESRPKGSQGFEGHPPRTNASRAPGLWQHLRVEFEAPRFDSTGKKTRNARFRRVVLNGFVVHENVEVTGPTRAPTFHDEQPAGPLMLQGDHGPVAFRNIRVKRYVSERVGVEDVRYRLYQGEFSRIGEYDTVKPTREGIPNKFTPSAVEKSGKFAVVFTGAFTIPRDGEYAFKVPFDVLSGSTVQLTIGDRLVVVPSERGSHPGTMALRQGRHPFRFDLVQAGPTGPAMQLIVEGPGIAAHTVTDAAPDQRAARTRELIIDPPGRVLVQRSFVPFEPRKRLYGVNIGTPEGAHFAYDFETGALLRAWRGRFLDTYMMWDNRGNGQLGRPAGPSVTFHARPMLALIEYGQDDNWPDQPEPLWSSQGYKLGKDGLPTFFARLGELAVRDRIAPTAEGAGLTRTVEITGELANWSTWLLLAEADRIVPEPTGAGWIIGDRLWYLDWPADAAANPVLRTHGARQQLAIPMTRGLLDKPITYTIVW